MPLSITLTLGAALLLLNIWLMIRCGQARRRDSVSVGDGGSEFLIRRMRAHSNFIESAPLFLVVFAALDLTLAGESSGWMWGLGVLFVISRLAHPLGMDGGKLQAGRMLGTLGTLVAMLALAVLAVLAVVSPPAG